MIMISVKEAQELILKHTLPFSSEKIPIEHSIGRVLQEDILADRDSPPFDRVTMDGIAIHAEQFKHSNKFSIENTQAAGQPRLTLLQKKNCIEVMTGSVLPMGTDCVIPYEQVEISVGIAEIKADTVTPLQYVHRAGSDAKKGEVLMHKGTVLTAGKVGVMAAVGVSGINVVAYPKVIICSTGDELVDIGSTPLPHQIRNSNAYMLHAALSALGIPADTIHLKDDWEVLKTELSLILGNYEILMFSGAVSKGKFDYLPEVLLELGLNKVIHGVAQRPGKPFLFGSLGKSLVFGFPGNPASTLVCFHAYFKPWLFQHLGVDCHEPRAILTHQVVFDKPLTSHLLVTLEYKEGKLFATPVQHSGSGDLVHLSIADGFLSLPAEINLFDKGKEYPITLMK